MKYGFIGTGNMGSALAKAIATKEKNMILHNRTMEKAENLAGQLGCTCGTMQEAAQAKFVFLGVKPYQIQDVIRSILPFLSPEKSVLVSMAAGITIDTISTAANGIPVIRIMPNTPVSLGKGVVLYSVSGNVSQEDEKIFLHDMSFCGLLLKIPEENMNAGCSLSGCGPAYMYMFANAMAKAAEELGLDHEQALQMAGYTMLGSAEMFLKSGQEPESLIRSVCSPGGSTIEGVKVLEEHHLDELCSETLQAAYKRNVEMGK